MNQQSLTLEPKREGPSFSEDGLVTEGDWKSFAVFSECKQYRYLLGRLWDDYSPDNGVWWDGSCPRRLMIFVMMNPSTADAFVLDPTLRKCKGFAERHHCGGMLITNLAAWRETHPENLRTVPDIIGPANLKMIRWAMNVPVLSIRVAAWGRLAKNVRERFLAPMGEAKLIPGMQCFGFTEKDPAEPRHPLMLSYNTKLVSLADGRPVA